MSQICVKCTSDPASYSFKKVSDKNGITTFYTNPAKAKIYKDHEEIVSHFDHSLERLGGKKWVWIFDGDGFDTDHVMEIKTGKNLASIIMDKYGDSLHEIKIINPSVHVKVIIKLIMPFFNNKIVSKIKMLDDRTYSILEFL